MGRELFLFTNSKHYCLPDLFKTVGACKDYIIKHHYKTQHNKKKIWYVYTMWKIVPINR